MRITLILACLVLFFSACKKDKYTTAPQITYKSISPNDISFSTAITPKLKFSITDAEGDLGDSSFVYVTNKLVIPNRSDSFPFPNIRFSAKSNFKADVEVELNVAHNCVPVSNVTDTIYYEVYIKDNAKHKSNVLTTPEPVYYRCF